MKTNKSLVISAIINYMSKMLKEFEIQVIKLLTKNVLSINQINDIEIEGKFDWL